MIVNRSPVADLALEVSFRKGSGVLRILDDGRAVSAEKYGSTYRVSPGYAEIFKVGGETSRACAKSGMGGG